MWLRLLAARAHLGRLPLCSAAAVAEDLVGDHAPLVLDDLGQDTREGEDILHDPLAGGRHGPRALGAAEYFVRLAKLETARVVDGVYGGEGGVGEDGGLEVREAVRVQRAAHLRGVAYDPALV